MNGWWHYYTERVTTESLICATTSDRDNGCVHFNSGIPNEAFYLAAAGGAGPKGDVVVMSVGPAKLQQILYRTLTADKLTTSSQFRDVARGSIDACTELAAYGLYAIIPSDCTHLEDTYRAVGLPLN